MKVEAKLVLPKEIQIVGAGWLTLNGIKMV